MITRGVVFVFLGGCIFCGLAVYAYNITQKLDCMIIPGIFAVILWLTAYAGYDYEKMTPEEKKKWEEEQERKKRMKQLDKKLRPKWSDTPSPGITD